MLFIFYKGVEIHLWSTHVDLLHHDHQHVAPSHRGSASHVLGILLCLASSFSYAMWLILQVTFQFNNNSNFYNSFLIYLFIYSIAIVFEDRQKWIKHIHAIIQAQLSYVQWVVCNLWFLPYARKGIGVSGSWVGILASLQQLIRYYFHPQFLLLFTHKTKRNI